MSLVDFFTPLNGDEFNNARFAETTLGFHISSYIKSFPVFKSNTTYLAVMGIQDGRNSPDNESCDEGPDFIRRQLYRLSVGSYNAQIADLGNIRAGNSVADTYAAVKTVVQELVKSNIVPILLGGGHHITYAQYLAYQGLEQRVDLAIIDSRLDMDISSMEYPGELTSENYLNSIFLHQPNYLFNFSNLGYQTYFVSPESLRVMDKLLFDVNRLGDFNSNIGQAEPLIRNADLLSFDISAIRSSDACANANATPNGFYGEQACQLCRYAGMSDKLSSFGIYEYNPRLDPQGQTAMLIAQMVWYFIDGYYQRKNDLPLQPKSHYLIYRASMQDSRHELVFIKSKKTDRWWMQVPYPNNNSANERYHLVPCLYSDYELAIAGEMPDLWWRTYQKLH